MMTPKEACEYLKKTYQLDVQPGTVTKWLNMGYVKGSQAENGRWSLAEEDIDLAIGMHSIPRKNGRKSMLTKRQREQIREMYDHKKWTLKDIAKQFGISESYVSLLVRFLR